MSENSGAAREQATQGHVNAAAEQIRRDREYAALRWSLGEALEKLDVLGRALAEAHELAGAAAKMAAGSREELGAVKAYLDQGSPFDYAAFPWDGDGREP